MLHSGPAGLMCTKNTRLSKFNVHKEHTRYPSLMCTKRTDPPSLVCTQHIEVLQVQCALSAHRPSMCCGLALEDCISYPPPHDQCGLYHHVFLFYPNHTVNEPVLISLKARVVILPSASSPFQPPGTPERWTWPGIRQKKMKIASAWFTWLALYSRC